MADGFQTLSEGDVATEAGWIGRFGVGPGIFGELLADGILRNAGVSSGKRMFTLNFVGLMAIGSSTWFAFPKATTARRWLDADIVLKSIVEYRHKFTRSPTAADFTATADRLYQGTLVDSFTSLVLWTLDRGFHHHTVDNSRSMHEGIDWARTINSTPAMHANGSVVYPSPVTRIQMQALSELAEIQAHALLDMRDLLGPFAATLAPDVEDLWNRCADVLEHASGTLHRASVEQTLDHHAGTTNRDEDIDLIALLRDWATEKWSAGPRLSAYGISSFHTVWEDACAQAVSAFGAPAFHADLASQPSYVIDGREIALTPQRPDILIEWDGSALVADAKWYLLDASLLPQTPDAIKQFAYELSIDAGTSVDANFLMLPSERHDRWAVVGSLAMRQAGMDDPRFAPVSVLALNWLYLLRLYIDRRCLPDEFMAEMVALRRPAHDLPAVQDDLQIASILN